MKAIVLGAGISGLTLAYYLQKQGADVTLLEASTRPGGWIRTDTIDGFRFERGPRNVRGRETEELARELGLSIVEANPTCKRRFLYYDNTLKPFRPPLRLLLERLKRPRKVKDESIASFFSHRIGEAATRLYINALVKGIYAGNIDELSIRSCFPNMWKKGRLTMDRNKLFSFPDGLESLPKKLAENLHILYGQRVEKVEPNRVFASGHIYEADRIYSTLPAYALGMEMPYTTLTLYNLGYHRPVLPKRGFGYLVAEPSKILGAVWDSCIFPLSPQETRITVMTLDATEEEVLAALEEHLGISQLPDVISRFLARKAIPQYRVGHHQRLETLPDHLLGSSFYGVSINDCIAKAKSLRSL